MAHCEKGKRHSAAVKVKGIPGRKLIISHSLLFLGRGLGRRRWLVDSLPKITISEIVKRAPITHEDRNNCNINSETMIPGDRKKTP